MSVVSERDIQRIVESVLSQCGAAPAAGCAPCGESGGKSIPLEISARHIHLTQEALETLFGPGYALTKKRDLSQPGEFLANERVKLVTAKGELANVAVLGPVRKAVQAEVSLTDARVLGISPPVSLSGHLDGAADVLVLGPKGLWQAKGAVIAAKVHIHMTPAQAADYGVRDGESVRVRVESARPMTFEDVLVRVNPHFDLAMHVDFDEANACAWGKGARATLLKK